MAQIVEMGRERRDAPAMAQNARFDDDDAGRPVKRRLARTLAVRPRPKFERMSELIRPEREIRAPAFCAAASAYAMKGRARCERDERIWPGRMRKSSSPLMVEAPHIASAQGNHEEIDIAARGAKTAYLAKSPHNPLKEYDRKGPHLAAFYLALLIRAVLHAFFAIVVLPFPYDTILDCSQSREAL